MSLHGKVAVVTGGGRGIGQAIAVVLAAEGAAVAVWDLNADSAEKTAAAIREAGGTAIAVAGDAADTEAVAAAAARTRAELGPVTIVVNNAGINSAKPFVSLTEEEWDRFMRINLKGPFLVTQALVPDMLEAGWGRIVNISSSSTHSGQPYMSHYVSAKSAVNGLTKSLALELGPSGITVNAIPPGFIDTPMLRRAEAQNLLGGSVEEHIERTPVRRVGKPEDIAATCSFLISEEAGYITGQIVGVNGGRNT